MKRLAFGIVLLLTALNVNAEITQAQAASFLIHNPAQKYKLPNTVNRTSVEALTPPMFSLNEKVKFSQGLQNFKVLQNLSNRGNSYAAYNVGLYMMLNKSKLGFDFSEVLVQLKKASDQGVLDAKYSLALIYQQQFMEVSSLVNTENKAALKLSKKEELELKNQIKADADEFKKIGQQYVLELAQLGHEKAFLASCNSYITGDFLKRSVLNAAVCYDNAIRIYDSHIAYGRLAKIYFDAPDFATPQFEQKGIDLAKVGAEKGDTYAMTILGKQLIYPNYLAYSNIDLGTQLIQGAAAHGDPIALDYMRSLFDGSGRLLRQPNKPSE